MGTSSNSIATRSDCNGLISGLFSSDLYKCTTKSEINSGKKLVVLEPDVVGNKTYPKSYTNNQLVKYDDLGYYTKCEYETDDGSNFSPIIKIYNKYIDPANESEPSDYIWELTPFNTSVTNSPTGSVDLGLSKDFFTSVNTSNVNITARNTASTTPLTKFKLNNYEGLASNNGNYFIWHMPNAASVIDSINSLKELIIFMTNIDNGYSISVNPSTWKTGYSANSTNVSVTSNDSWHVISTADWLSFYTDYGDGEHGNKSMEVKLDVDYNPINSPRTGSIIFVCDHDLSKTAIVTVTQAGNSTNPEEPTINVIPTSITVDYSSRYKYIEVTSNVNWSVNSNVDWITISKPFGTGNDMVQIYIKANDSTSERSGTVTFKCTNYPSKTAKVTIIQSGKSTEPETPTYIILANPTTGHFEASGGSIINTFYITSNDSWTASSNKSWLTVGTTSGTGNGYVTLTADSNDSTSERSGIVTFTCDSDSSKTATITITQNGKSTEPEEPDTPTYNISVNPSTWKTGYSANSTNVSVTSNDSWTASSNKSWLTVGTTSGTGNASVVLEVTKNPTTSSRSGIVTFVCDHDTSKTAIVSVTQNGKSTEPEEPDTPTYRLSVTVSESNINAGSSTNVTAKFYTKTNGVEDNGTTVTTSCTWESSDSNIASVGTTGRVTSKSGKYGTVTITATYTVNGQTYSASVPVTVNYTRNYISLSSSSVTLVVGETHQLTATYYTETNGVITDSKDVTNETTWSGGSGYVSCDSNGLVTALKNSYNNEFSITASYNGYSAKCGFIVTAEPEEPTYFISVENKDSFTWNPASDEDELSVSVTSNDSWTASSNADWLTLSKSSGTGNSSVTLNVTANSSTSKRSGTVTFVCYHDTTKTAKVEVTQDEKSTTYSISVSKTTWNSPYTGSATNVKVTSNDSWTVSSNQSWLTVSNTTGTTITSGTGNQTVILTTTENTSTSSRSATVTFVCNHDTTKTAKVEVTQDGGTSVVGLLNSISVNKSSVSNTVGKSSLVIITANYSNGTTKNVTSSTTGSVTSGNTLSASYNAGIISHNAVGTAEITVSYAEGSITKTCTINVETTAETSGFIASSKIKILSAINPISTIIGLVTAEIGIGLTSGASGTDVSKTYYDSDNIEGFNISNLNGPILSISYTLPYELNASTYNNLYFMIKLSFDTESATDRWGLKVDDHAVLPTTIIGSVTPSEAAAGHAGGLLRLSDYWTYGEFMNGNTTPLKLYVTGSPKL